MSVAAIVVAGGLGSRIKSNIPKQYLKIGGKEIIIHTLQKFEKIEQIDEIIVAVNKDYLKFCEEELLRAYELHKCKFIEGGETRQESVYNGLKCVKNDTEIVLIHDSVRPFVEESKILELIQETFKNGSCTLGVKVKDTIKICNIEREIIKTPKRETLWAMQTPQCFKYEILRVAHEIAISENFVGTDDCILVERIGGKVKVIESSYGNIKITSEEDLKYSEFVIDYVNKA